MVLPPPLHASVTPLQVRLPSVASSGLTRKLEKEMKNLDSIEAFLPLTLRIWDKSARETYGGRGSCPQCLPRAP